MKPSWVIAASTIAIASMSASESHATEVEAPAGERANAPVVPDDIVVTARRREERLNNVPIAITALSEDRLKSAQIMTPKELSQFVPSLNVNTGNAREGNRLTLRGQGASLGAGEAVVSYLAEAPIPPVAAGAAGMIFDLQNVQVLNGPQGTLFGRNSTGGAVLFTPQAPKSENGGYIEAGYGNYNNREFNGVFNVALVPDKVLLRVAGTWRQRDGFTRNMLANAPNDRLDDTNYYGLRATLLIRPFEGLENSTIFQRSESKTNGTGLFLEEVSPTAPGFQAELDAALARQKALGARELENNGTFFLQRTNLLVNTTTLELADNMRVKNIFSYVVSRSKNGYDLDGSGVSGIFDEFNGPLAGNTSAPGLSHQRYISEELQFSGEFLDQRLTLQAGAFLQDFAPAGHTETSYIVYGEPYLYSQEVSGKSKALYAQGTLDFGAFSDALSSLRLTAGYRYTWDSKHETISQHNPDTLACVSRPATISFPNCTVEFDGKWSQGTYTLGLDYKITPDVLIYATTRRGYKSGGFNVFETDPDGPFADFARYDPETITDYEIGLKAAYRAGGLSFNTTLAGFTANYKGIQRTQTVIILDNPPLVNTLITNAASAKISGIELQQVVSAGGFTLDGNLSYLDAHYKSFVLPNGTDISGQELPYSPKWKWGINASYRTTTSVGDLTVRAGYSWSGRVRFSDPETRGNFFGGYGLANASATLSNVADTPLDIDLYMTNVLNKTYVQQRFPFYNSFGYISAFNNEPRMYGFRLRYNF